MCVWVRGNSVHKVKSCLQTCCGGSIRFSGICVSVCGMFMCVIPVQRVLYHWAQLSVYSIYTCLMYFWADLCFYEKIYGVFFCLVLFSQAQCVTQTDFELKPLLLQPSECWIAVEYRCNPTMLALFVFLTAPHPQLRRLQLLVHALSKFYFWSCYFMCAFFSGAEDRTKGLGTC